MLSEFEWRLEGKEEEDAERRKCDELTQKTRAINKALKHVLQINRKKCDELTSKRSKI